MTSQRQMKETKKPHRIEESPETAQDSIFEGYVTEEKYARQRGVSVRTCQRDRALRKAPPHVVLGNRIFYRVEAVRAWLETRERNADRRRQYWRPSARR